MSVLIQKEDKIHTDFEKNIINFILLLWIVFLTALTVIRSFYGVEITDEAFYVSEAVSVVRGNIPYAYVMGRTAGFTFVMFPFVKLYSVFFPGLEGLFIYTRLAFILFRFTILVIAYRLLKNYYNRKYLIFVLSLLIPVSGISIPNFSYNTISEYLFFLTGVIQLWGFQSEDTKNKYKGAVLSGIIVAFAEMAHPGQILNVFWFGITYLICYKKERIRYVVTYAISGILTLMTVLIVFAVQSSPGKLMFGIETILKWTNADTPSLTLQEQMQYIYHYTKWEMIVFGGCIIAYFFVCLFLQMSKRIKLKKESKVLENSVNFMQKVEISDFLLLAVLICSIKLLIKGNAEYNAYYLGFSGLALTAVCGALMLKKEVLEEKEIQLLCMMFPFFQVIVTGLFTNTIVFFRLEPFIFSIFGFGIMLHRHFKDAMFWKKLFIVGSLSIVCLTVLYNNYNYIYRDDELHMLDTKVDSGIYKNIYTTPEKAHSLVELEEYIREKTDKEEKVLFMDLAPMAYFMTDAIPWTPSTWDRMQYYRGFNRPEIVYRYFQNRGDIPDKIIYIDSGRDEKLSIDTEGYLFNDFVNNNYELTSEDILNDMFCAKIYTLRAS